ncbi:hypothetical protein HJC23_004996 [Cyclotella cryptica]|uniref:SET domain-containing protein n=1 Tax=Cyclotella cryptica TaxID=29204 RepID=A0ABD3QEJ9_9STRA|eukprot:CCRYP_006208-RA/>CCRYP_006208-RA protein AED:0.04 eAED:-0.01 QI:0/0/0/1/1/1/2/0/678
MAVFDGLGVYSSTMIMVISCSILQTTLCANNAETISENSGDVDSDPCMLYIAESTINNAGIGMFAGVDFRKNQLIGRDNWGDAAFSTVDLNWHNSLPNGQRASKSRGDYHWPLVNYDWTSSGLGVRDDAADASMTVTGFGAVPNCHFSLLNVKEHHVMYDLAGLSRYDSPGSGAITPFFNRTSTARKDIAAGSELFVNYGSKWFTGRDGFDLVPVKDSYTKAGEFLDNYGLLLLGMPRDEKNSDNDWKYKLTESVLLKEDARRDFWNMIKSFPYPSRARQALPTSYKDVVKAILKGIDTVEVDNSMRSLEYLKQFGKCVDNIIPGNSTIPHAGRGAFATRFIPKGGLVAPAPLLHFADKSTINIYNGTRFKGKYVKNETDVLSKQIILNYMFGHPNSTLHLFPYSHHVAYINHHSTKFNAKVQWAADFSFYHREELFNQSVEMLENQITAGLMLEYIAVRNIHPGEEILIDYGDAWQHAWDKHVESWTPATLENDFNNLTYWTKPSEEAAKTRFKRAEMYNNIPIKTMEEQKLDPYPRNIEFECYVNLEIGIGPYFEAPKTTPFYKRDWVDSDMVDGKKISRKCNITGRFDIPEVYFDDINQEDRDHHPFFYTVELNNVRKKQGKKLIYENHVITEVPYDAILMFNTKYSSDTFLKNAFRHEMRLPNDIFPTAWMNLL